LSAVLDQAVSTLLRDVAERIVLPRYQTLGADDITEKTPGDLVTIADRESEAALSEALARLLPEAAIVGEEASAANPALRERLGDSLVWIIDPIDGTHNFAQGKPPFALMVALAAAGETQAGWIYDPLARRMLHARAGAGAFINGEQIYAHASGQAQLIGGISTLFLPGPRRTELEARAAAGNIVMAAIPRCAGEQYPRIALGQNDFALFERTLAWDHAPGALWLSEAGGKVARPDNTPYRIAEDRTGLIAAASPAIWEHAAKALFS
jgi:fructose-1,6-bisphosphatase/inositol monophosphatase family enzyme